MDPHVPFERSSFWNHICSTSARVPRPRLLVGDLNSTLLDSERSGLGSLRNAQPASQPLHDFVTDEGAEIANTFLHKLSSTFTVEDLENPITEEVTTEANEELASIPSEEEITVVLYFMNPWKGPGLDASQAMPIYTMTTTNLLRSICSSVAKSLRRFWWDLIVQDLQELSSKHGTSYVSLRLQRV
ncbi:hypothetical protein PanWU01x14_276960 [Parasponia andersonii]|uniref:Endonuclease/exonuclease/phosphatase n=1 Tax=Parasponia andersonii TaxID=3476 RepID=A0A2P5B2L2_PARAD|nr:hypothetical protein PanWU01x14_276960 [Parasponia andersonii]